MEVNLKNFKEYRDSDDSSYVIAKVDTNLKLYKHDSYWNEFSYYLKIKKHDILEVTAYSSHSEEGFKIDLYHLDSSEELSIPLSNENNLYFEFLSKKEFNKIKFKDSLS